MLFNQRILSLSLSQHQAEFFDLRTPQRLFSEPPVAHPSGRVSALRAESQPMQKHDAASTHAEHCRGQAGVEWLVSAIVILTCLTMIFEVMQWLLMRQTLQLYVQRAVEYGAMRGGQTQAIYQHLLRHLPSTATLHLGAVCVRDDVTALMQDFKDTPLSRDQRQPLIRYNHIDLQRKKAANHTFKEGVGPHSGLSIAQANVLHARVTAYIPVRLLWMQTILGSVVKVEVMARAVMQSHRQQLSQTCVGNRAENGSE